MNSPLNSPLYTTFLLFTPLWPIIFPSPPPFAPPLSEVFGAEKNPDQWPGHVVVGRLLIESYDDPSVLQGERRRISGLLLDELYVCR